MTNNIVIVNDGAYRWGADRAKLEAALERLGWKQDGRYWTEPKVDDEDDPAAAYTALCQAVSPLDGMDSANGEWNEPSEGAWDDLPELYCRADRGGKVWELRE
jgi:hypothetical protein